MRVPQVPGPEEQYHCKTSLTVTPFGSKITASPVNTRDGRVKVSTFPETSPVDGAGGNTPLHVAPVIVQPPFSSNVIVKALAGILANAKNTPTASSIGAERAAFTIGQNGIKRFVTEGLATKSDFMIATSNTRSPHKIVSLHRSFENEISNKLSRNR